MIIRSKIDEPLNSIKWINQQKRYVWLNVSDIPESIFYSVWEYIETKNVSLDVNNSLYKIIKP